MKINLSEKINKLITELLNLKSSPHEVAKSFAIGLIVGLLPGTGPVAAIILAFVLKLNRAATLIGSLLTNTWTTLFFFTGSIAIGNWILQLNKRTQPPVGLSKDNLTLSGEMVKHFAVPFIVGGIILTLFIGLVGYFIVYLIIKRSSDRNKS